MPSMACIIRRTRRENNEDQIPVEPKGVMENKKKGGKRKKEELELGWRRTISRDFPTGKGRQGRKELPECRQIPSFSRRTQESITSSSNVHTYAYCYICSLNDITMGLSSAQVRESPLNLEAATKHAVGIHDNHSPILPVAVPSQTALAMG